MSVSTPASSRATGSQAAVNVVVAGCGYWGKNLVRNFHQIGALAAISDPDPTTAENLASQFDVHAKSWAAVLSDDSISAVAIAAPAELHYRLAREALDAGKHVFVEKPLALEVVQAEELCELAAAKRRVLMVGHLLQYHAAFLQLKEIVQRGDLGRLQYVYSNRLNLGKIRHEENILWSFAPHDISMILALIGDEPEIVTALGAAYLHRRIADVTTTHMSFPGGQQAHIHVSWLHPFKEQKLVVVGEKAMAVFDDGQPWQNKLQLFPHRINWVDGKPAPAKADAVPVEIDEAEPLRQECQHFLDCIESGSPARTDGAEGLRVLRVLNAAQRSIDEGKSVNLRDITADLHSAARHDGVTIHESAYVDEPASIGPGTRIWHFSHILSGSRIGRNCVVGQNVSIGPDVTVGDNCKFQNNVSVYRGVTIEDGVFCGPSCVFTNVMNPRAEVERKNEFKPTLVKRGATVGANATIVCGNTLGRYCFIGAGAVVTSDVPDYALMVGAPARRIGWMSKAGERLGPDLICPIAGTRYREVGPDALEES
jgi:UDP-2-acetamido-3-amino-2,3-dideoxy-glucuronate N-acetyltransferase